MTESPDSIPELETWKPVDGWDALYEVSSLGRLRSTGAGRRHSGRVLRGWRRKGYVVVSLGRGTPRSRVDYYLHALVAAAFIGPRPAGLQINHIDATKSNNRVDNLEYVTAKQNQQHAARLGLKFIPLGASNGRSKVTPTVAREIRELHASGRTRAEIARMKSLGWTTVNHIVRGSRWTP